MQITLHSLKFDIQTHSLDIQPWVERLYTSHELTEFSESKSASLKLCLESKDSSHAAEIAPGSQGIFAETNLCLHPCFYSEGRFFSASDGEYWHEMEYDYATHTIRANLGGAYLQCGHSIIINIIRPILQSFLLPFYGLKTFHGAVASKNDKNVFLSGSGGMGKTTTAIQLMREGYALLSDDGPFFTRHNDKVYALSSLDFLHLTENTLQLFPELKEHTIGEKDNRGKFAVSLATLQKDQAWLRPQQITHFIELRRGQVAVPRIEKLDKSRVLQDLLNDTMIIFRRLSLGSNALPLRGYSALIFDLVAGVIKDAETYRLDYADHHLTEIPNILDHL